MKPPKNLIVILVLFSVSIYAQQDTLSLVECLKAANINAAVKPQTEIAADISELRVRNTGTSNLPSLSAFGKATYQSDAVAVNFPIPGSEGLEVDLFQYNFGLEANQKLFDGGMSGKNKALEIATRDAELSRLETELYPLNDRVTKYYFTCLLLTENLKIIELKADLLSKREAELKAGVRNGMVRKTELDKIQVEMLSTEQQVMEIEKLRLQALNALQILTGITISENVQLARVDDNDILPESNRPEYNYFQSEELRIDKLTGLKSVQNMPKIYAFGQAGYSYPSLNMFVNKSDYYYIIGAKLSWPIFDWNHVRREKQVLQLQKDIIATKRNDFERNNSILLTNERIEQEKLSRMIKTDGQIIGQRQDISAVSASSLANGVITSTAYIEDLNAEIKARIDMETHKIQYQNSLVRMAILKGIDVAGD